MSRLQDASAGLGARQSAAQRHFRFGAALSLALLAAAVLGTNWRVAATNHLVFMNEVMAGANGDSKVQFVEMKLSAGGQNCWGPQVASNTPGADSNDNACGSGETRSRAQLTFFDALDREIGRFKFPENPPSSSNLTVLIATSNFAALAGAPTPDLIMPPLMSPENGKVCFTNNPENSVFAITACLSYGTFAGNLQGGGPAAAPALPITDATSLKRTSGDQPLNSLFAISTSPTPLNSSGQTMTMTASSNVVQGQNLFNGEGFGGNGRTCGSCHVASLNGGLTPSFVQTRFADLTNSFDPLLVAETADTGFDFNVNTLTVTARPQHNSGTDFLNTTGGDLQGIITSGGGARGKVLTRVSSTVYRIYGGLSPALTGTVTDASGNAATVVSVVAGGLNALETPSRMRTSVASAFPQGRALILENIDGFANAPVFRKSPHFLNLSRTSPFGFSDIGVTSLQAFATGAVQQHFPRTLTRSSSNANPDFRLPTAAELVRMEAFMQAQDFPPDMTGFTGDAKFALTRFVKFPEQQRGQDAFFGSDAKCSMCHGGTVLASTTAVIQGKAIGTNAFFNTGVVNNTVNGAGVDNLPCEPAAGFGACGSREFSTPQLFNVKNLAPFFHDASVATLRDAVDFYSSTAFQNSPAGQAIGGVTMSASTLADIVSFLESLSNNSVERITDLTVVRGASTGAIAFRVTDLDTALTSLSLSASSSNTTLVPVNNIAFGGSGGDRTVTVTTANLVGNATITVTASDGTNTSSSSFVLTTIENTAPTITAVADQTTNEDTATSAIALTVGDAETAVAALTLAGASSNTTLVPVNNIVFGGSGANRTVTITPAADQFGSANITVTVSDGTLTANRVFALTVTAVNDAPTITALNAQTTNEDTATGAVAFTIGDVETAAAALTMSGSSSNTTIVPNGNIVFGGSGASRNVTVTPAADQNGSATITVTVSDGGLSANRTFTLTVTAVNDAPTITALNAQTTNEDTATGAVAFTIGDVETAAAALTMSGSSSDTTIVPNGNIVFGGSDASRNVTVTPAADQNGSATITVTVSDGGLSASRTFTVTVTAVNDAPTITAIAAQTIDEDVATGAIAFTIADVDTAIDSLTLAGASSNTTVIPNANVVFGGSGGSRTVTITPAANQSGSATVTVTVSDGTLTANRAIAVTINAVNDAPTLTAISDQTINAGTPTSTLALTIGDVETDAASLSVTPASSNTTLIPVANIVTGGSGAARTLRATPANNQVGQATITVSVSDGQLSASRTFTVTVSAPTAVAAQPAALRFGATKASAAAPLQNLTAPQDVTVSFTGGNSSWTVTADRPWVQISQGSGFGPGLFTVAVSDPTNLIGGATSLGATITITASLGPTVAIPLTLTVQPTGTSQLPFGGFDTPIAGITVEGSIAVSGWALDDIGVDRVEIWRDRAPGETTPVFPGPGLGNGKIFVANVFFLTGARPDIASQFPTFPQSARAGWGYLLLTQGLWNQGNGPFTLHAFAYDNEGRSSSLGSKSLVASNSTASKPFGAIDTPTYGQTVSGGIWNFGWALTPGTCANTNGRVRMAIDSGALIPVNYGDLRTDIAAAFPGYTNGTGAGGSIFIDTTTLTNGVHQIGWFVEDNCNRAEGIGSRFFTVLNTVSSPATMAAPAEGLGGSREAETVAPDTVSVQLDGGDATPVLPEPDGWRSITVTQGSRMVVQLPSGASYAAYQLANGERTMLPLGSSYDEAAGAFRWDPAPAYLGTYYLVFVAAHGSAIPLEVIVKPQQ